ncbi:medium-chain fatty acid ethyl ester synthase/esterase 1 [Nannizzia gypsea CBS 118893]|uniref:alcohol O-acetyltransferase n=1 Tax=Arthroderma gypseum (strain ATCC MYA-4604 / CBS 118893) TaxID=535722 RepID=E4UZG9_ARTGP|nr:medium-chain fatty acid ethyl ester synthase/esterase 1 [Nannizzia gypsea CBS 118893]EFR03499.1 medium-chain fatty acid ethyl ester synthase/esterase 1 [Nannizzia gypsea CBS 118893]
MGVFSWLLPNGRVSFHHSGKSVILKRKPQKANPGVDESKYISLADLCKSATPADCQLNPFLFNGHLQTAWTLMRTDDIPVYYKRWRFEGDSPDYRGSFEVDFVVEPYNNSKTSSNGTAIQSDNGTFESSTPPDSTHPSPRTSFFTEEEFSALPSDDKKPMLVVLHGLSGGSHEPYLRNIVDPLHKQGWEVCVVNFRGCANSKVTSSILYNARATWDVRQTVRWIRKNFPSRPLFGIGFSLGANILTNYVGEEGEDCQLKAAVVCSNPWNLEVSSLALQRTWVGSQVYSRTMGSSMKRLFEQHVDKLREHPRVDVERVRKTTYLHEFDRELQAPVWGYPTETAYYRDASSIDSLFAVKIPLFAIQAEDDAISSKEALPYLEMTKTPYAVMCTTSWGGHLSWFEYGGGRWFTKPVVNFLNKMASEIDLDAPLTVVEEEPESKLTPATSSERVDGPHPDFKPMRRKLHMPIPDGEE